MEDIPVQASWAWTSCRLKARLPIHTWYLTHSWENRWYLCDDERNVLSRNLNSLRSLFDHLIIIIRPAVVNVFAFSPFFYNLIWLKKKMISSEKKLKFQWIRPEKSNTHYDANSNAISRDETTPFRRLPSSWMREKY